MLRQRRGVAERGEARVDGTAIVTGASYGLGVTMAEALAEAGANVVLAARSKEKLAEVVAAIQSRGGSAIGVACADSNVMTQVSSAEVR